MKNVLKNVGYFLLTMLTIVGFTAMFMLIMSLIFIGVIFVFKSLSFSIASANLFLLMVFLILATSIISKDVKKFFERRKTNKREKQ